MVERNSGQARDDPWTTRGVPEDEVADTAPFPSICGRVESSASARMKIARESRLTPRAGCTSRATPLDHRPRIVGPAIEITTMTSAPATHCRVSGLSRHLVSDAKALSTPPNHHHLEQRLGALMALCCCHAVTKRLLSAQSTWPTKARPSALALNIMSICHPRHPTGAGMKISLCYCLLHDCFVALTACSAVTALSHDTQAEGHLRDTGAEPCLGIVIPGRLSTHVQQHHSSSRQWGAVPAVTLASLVVIFIRFPTE
ncbi:hypothetical protein T310_1659 [Rasamsonia emersonii CBS 393.64]|uniref:Uncharacterized protein n=1 Tax=Rasamsonia emersonii (strain ATCC 16479 / CBS 393.64 / IMI 116815) TaxID=1408163 RepID=A0A0F4Z2K0_RASE3|nr:hypothetical protein T310_1659 [Rasamsonia emersonii CBS 393.64]KKA24306.1 hypothetical protein T310_1659 [Rasamsonia emersonii CBS 393.64]